MRITLFTSNNNRHKYLINLLSNCCNQLYVVQECKTLFTGKNDIHYQKSEIIEKYFTNVQKAQNKFFKTKYVNTKRGNIKTLPIVFGEVNNLSLSDLEDCLKSDLYIVFGSSYLKGFLVDFLVSNKSINIHAGVSPYYRGTDSNFWASFDDNPHLVGATIHMLSKGLDNGPILYHAMSNIKTNPFEYAMSTVKSAFHSLAERITNKSIFEINPEIQNKDKLIRYTKKIEFNDEVVKKFFNKKINLKSKSIDNSYLKDPYYLDE